MSLTNITIGANTYVSYASVAEADAYLAVDPNRGATWAGLTTDQKGEKLVSGTRRLDLLNYKGEKTGGAAQENKWPRTGVTYPNGEPVSTTEVPLEIENATILLAGSIALDASNAEQGSSGSNTKKVEAGSAKVTFFRQQAGVALQDETAYTLIIPFLESSGDSLGILASGTDGESTFDDSTRWNRNRGFP